MGQSLRQRKSVPHYLFFVGEAAGCALNLSSGFLEIELACCELVAVALINFKFCSRA